MPNQQHVVIHHPKQNETSVDSVVRELIEQGHSFIPFEGLLEQVPPGFQYIRMRLKGEGGETVVKYLDLLIPDRVLSVLQTPWSPGMSGSFFETLDLIGSFYHDITAYEGFLKTELLHDVFPVRMRQVAKEAYTTHLINAMIVAGNEPPSIRKIHQKYKAMTDRLITALESAEAFQKASAKEEYDVDLIKKIAINFMKLQDESQWLENLPQLDYRVKADIAVRHYQTQLVEDVDREMKRIGYTPQMIFNSQFLKKYHVKDKYVEDRLKTIAMILCQVSESELQQSALGEILWHVTYGVRKEKEIINLSVAEATRVSCYNSSHFELRDEFKGAQENGWKYEINKQYQSRSTAPKGKKSREIDVKIIEKYGVRNDAVGVSELMDQALTYIKDKTGEELPSHFGGMLMQYTNLKYVATTDKNMQMDIIPAMKKE